MFWFDSAALTFLQLVLHHHQEGHTYHEEVEAETDLAQLAHSLSTHLSHYVLIGLLSADRRGIAEDHQTADEEYQGYLQVHRREELNTNLPSKTRLILAHKHTLLDGL